MVIITPWPHFFQSYLHLFIPSLHSHHYYLRSYPHALFLYIYIFLKIVLLFTYLPTGIHCEDTTRLTSKRKLSFTGLALPKYSFFFSNCLPIKFKVLTVIINISYNLAPAFIFQHYHFSPTQETYSVEKLINSPFIECKVCLFDSRLRYAIS